MPIFLPRPTSSQRLQPWWTAIVTLISVFVAVGCATQEPLPTQAPLPTHTPYPTLAALPTRTPAPSPSPTPMPEPTLSAAKHEELRQELSALWRAAFRSFQACSDDEFDGKRRESDLVAYSEAKEILDGTLAAMDARGHMDDYTSADFEDMTNVFTDAGITLLEICFPRGGSHNPTRPCGVDIRCATHRGPLPFRPRALATGKSKRATGRSLRSNQGCDGFTPFRSRRRSLFMTKPAPTIPLPTGNSSRIRAKPVTTSMADL